MFGSFKTGLYLPTSDIDVGDFLKKKFNGLLLFVNSCYAWKCGFMVVKFAEDSFHWVLKCSFH